MSTGSASTFLYLNTRNATSNSNSGTSNNQLSWKLSSARLSTMDGFYLSIKDVQLPNAVYPINSYYCKISFFEHSGTTKTVTIPSGAYTGDSIATAIGTAMTAATGIAATYTASYSTTTYCLTISSTDTFYLVDATNSCYEQLGFNVSSFGTTLASSATGSFPVNLAGSAYVDVISNLSTRNTTVSTTANILVRIPLDYGFGNWITLRVQESEKIFISNPNIDLLSIELRDDRGNPWVLPANSNLSMTLQIDPVPNPYSASGTSNNPGIIRGDIGQNHIVRY